MQRTNTAGLTAVGLSLCLLAACSERRTTGPGEPPVISAATTKLPALSVYDDPIIALSDTIWGGREANDLFDLGYGINLRRPDDPAFDRVSDIVFGYAYSYSCIDVRVYNPRDSIWVRIDAPWHELPCPTSWSVGWEAVWNLSEAAISFDDIMQHGGQRFQLGGDRFGCVNARLVRYHDDYRCIRLGRNQDGHAPWTTIRAMTWGDGKIWVAVTCASPDNGAFHRTDSIWAFDTTGMRVIGYEHHLGQVWGLEYYEGELLALAAGENRALVALDEAGNITHSVCWDNFTADMTIAMGRLWLPHAGVQSLRGFVLDSAFWQGNTRIDWDFHVPVELPFCWCQEYFWQDCNCIDVTWDGSYFYIQTDQSISKINLSNQLVGRYTLPVAYPRRLAWDGEAFWVVHQGPPQTESATLWLSRFRLP